MLRLIPVHRFHALVKEAGAYAVVTSSARNARPKAHQCNAILHQGRSLCLSSSCESPDTSRDLIQESPLPDAPPMSKEMLDFLGECARDSVDSVGDAELVEGKLPEAPSDTYELDPDLVQELVGNEAELDVSPSSTFKTSSVMEMYKGLESKVAEPQELEGGKKRNRIEAISPKEDPNSLETDPEMIEAIASWARATAPTPAGSPMPLHELANKSFKVKELVKLGVDMSVIVKRHAHMERLLHLSWEDNIKPHIRFFVDCGVDPDRLGQILTKNTPLLWTDIEDMKVRINYLESKLFTPDEIKRILNGAPFWLTLQTKEIDRRLGFLQRTFQLQGSEVRSLVTSHPTLASSNKWPHLVNSTKLMDREFGFNALERKELLFKSPYCYLRLGTLRKSFNYCHNQIGLKHSQIVKHPSLLRCRASVIKPRHQFLKFLKRDNFNVDEPDYVSPDWLWRGTIDEFCEKAAKSTVEEYETFLKNAPL